MPRLQHIIVALAACAVAQAKLGEQTTATLGSEVEAQPRYLERLLPPVDKADKPGNARYLAHRATWGVLSTTSTKTGVTEGRAWGNPYSFVDGGWGDQTSTGTPYFYGSNMDQSFKDLQANPEATFTLSEENLG